MDPIYGIVIPSGLALTMQSCHNRMVELFSYSLRMRTEETL